MLVLLSATDPAATPAVLRRAAAELDLPWDLGPAEAAGLVRPNSGLRFVHPLAASAVYTRASPRHRRTAHAALSRASEPAQDADHRTWHAACAAPGPEKEIAAALEESAERAQCRGDPGGAARLLMHAAAMTPDSSRRGTRTLAAAEGHLSTNALDEAAGLIAVATTCRLEDTEQARLARVRARALLALRSAPEAAALLLVHAAEQFAAVEAGPSSAMASPVQSAARQTYLEALSATALAGHVQGSGGAHAVAASARHHLVGRPLTPTDLFLEGLSTLLTDFPHHGVGAVRRALATFADETPRGADATIQWLMLAPLAQQTFIHHLWDFPAWARLSSRATRLARVVGDLSILPVELMCSAGANLQRGKVDTAAALVAEADSISAATGTAPYTDAALIVAAWRGEEDHVLRLIDEGRDAGTLHGELSLRGVAGYASGVLYNGLNRYDLAMEATRDGFEHDLFNFTGWSLAEHIEAAARAGDRAAATGVLDQLAEHTRPADTAWAHGIQVRCEALVADVHQAEEKFQQARHDLSQAGIEIQVARTHLLYGEWLLQRPGRSADAEDELRTAHREFTAMHAHAFAARAGRALTSSGLAVPSYNASLVAVLTPQELQIAQRAARGLTSQAIAAELFLSVQTVEFHLHQAFAKLNVHDLLQLREIVRTSDDPRG
jgi:DNA-binding CsgD family transcriptional regulator